MIETIAFVLGAIVGGLIAKYAFGKPKNAFDEFLEIIIFYLIAIIIYSRFIEINWVVFLFIGFISSIVSRGVSSKFDTAKIQFSKRVGRVGLLIGLNNALKRRGFTEEEIKMIAKEVGFKDKEIREVIK